MGESVLPSGENKMGVRPIPRLLATMALPMVIAMLVQALYNVVDSFYVAKIADNATTALSLVFPVQNILIGFATGIGVGVNSLMSKCLGQKDPKAADRAAGNGIVLALVATGLFVLFGLFGSESYYGIQSRNESTVAMSSTYSSICCIWSLGLFAEVLGERMLQSSGRTVYTLLSQGTGAIINIVLDPILIFGVEALGIPEMGIAGAAVATVIGQWIAGALAIFFNFKFNPDVHFRLKYLLPRREVMVPILTVGIPSIIMMAIGSVMNFSMNQILRRIDLTETAMGVFGVYFKLQSFFFMPLFGMNNAAISIIAFNYGAQKPERILKTLKCTVLTAVCITLGGLAVFQLFPDQLMGLFGEDTEFLRVGRSALRTISLHFPLAAIGIALGASFQALGVGIYSTITSLMRQLVALIPIAFLLSLSGQVTMVWWAFPLAEFVSVLTTLVLYSRIYRNKIKPLMAA